MEDESKHKGYEDPAWAKWYAPHEKLTFLEDFNPPKEYVVVKRVGSGHIHKQDEAPFDLHAFPCPEVVAQASPEAARRWHAFLMRLNQFKSDNQPEAWRTSALFRKWEEKWWQYVRSEMEAEKKFWNGLGYDWRPVEYRTERHSRDANGNPRVDYSRTQTLQLVRLLQPRRAFGAPGQMQSDHSSELPFTQDQYQTLE